MVQDVIWTSFQIIQVPRPCGWAWEYSNKGYRSRSSLVAKGHMWLPKAMFLPQFVLEIAIWDQPCGSCVLVCHRYVTRVWCYHGSMGMGHVSAQIVSLRSFGNTCGKSCTKLLILDIKFRFTCGELDPSSANVPIYIDVFQYSVAFAAE